MEHDDCALVCIYCGSQDLELIEEIVDGDLRMQAYECHVCGKFSYRDV